MSLAPRSASKAAMNSLGRTLGNEEKEVVTVSVRPGTPNTDMQTKIRELGKSFKPLAFLAEAPGGRNGETEPVQLTRIPPACRRFCHVGI